MARPKKIHHFHLKPYKNTAGSQSWRVTGTKSDGARVRRNFAEKTEAVQALADLESEISGHVGSSNFQRTRLSPDELASAEAAVLSAFGRDLSAIVTHYLALESRALTKGLDLNGAVSFAESHYRSEIKTVSIFTAYGEFIDSRESRSPKTKEHYESSLKLLLKGDPNRHVHSFTVSDVEKALARYTNVNSKRTYQRAFRTFFNWCVRHHYCLEDPCKRLDKLPRDMSRIAVLSLDEVERLLLAAMRLQDGAAAASVAIGLFAGLRPSEIADLKAEDITGRGIRVSGGKLRRVLKRSVPIPRVLAAWLAKYPFEGLPGGWAYKLKALRKETGAKTWVQDIIRHTSITFQTERDRNEALTAFNCGTSIQMMNRHYRNTIDDAKAVARFWSLTPASLRAGNPEAARPALGRVQWPDAKTLARLVWEKPLVHAAAALGVSDVALRKRCVRLGIALPPRGYWLRG